MATSKTNRTLRKYEVSRKQESEWMSQYTKDFTPYHIFAADLTAHVMKMCNLKFDNFFATELFGGERYPTEIDTGIKKLIELVVPEITKKTTHSLMGMTINLKDANYSEFKCFANAWAFQLEKIGCDYLGFCILIASMCSVANKHGIRMAPDFGIMLMCRMSRRYLCKSVAPNMWQEMKSFARQSVDLMETRLRGASECSKKSKKLLKSRRSNRTSALGTSRLRPY